MTFTCLECCTKFTLTLKNPDITLPSSVNLQALHCFNASTDDDLLTEQLTMQDLSRLFGHTTHLDRYDIRHMTTNASSSDSTIDHTRFPLAATHGAVRLDACKQSEMVVMAEFRVISDGRLAGIREVRLGATYEGSRFEFEVNGVIHGKRMLEQSLRFVVKGSDIIEAIERRLENLRRDMRNIRVKKIVDEREIENFITVKIPKSPLAFDFHSPNL